MFVYKITNIINGKMYIGQTTRPIKDRFDRHIQDAMSERLNTHFARAIRKYGAKNFVWEQIDSATTQQELTDKEYYWIEFYNSTVNGYNETDSKVKCGGNTYFSKTDAEMQIIKEKIKITKLGGLNPNSTKVKCKNTQTGDEYFFDSCAELQAFLGLDNHNGITRRCNHTIHCLLNVIWAIAYAGDEYDPDLTISKGSRRGIRLYIKNTETGETVTLTSCAAGDRYCNLPPRYLSNRFCHRDRDEIRINNYIIQVIK